MSIRLEYVTKTRESVMESLWREFQIVLNNYTSYTKEFYDDYVDLRRKDDIETKLNQKHYKEISRCMEIIADYRLDIDSKVSNFNLTKTHLQRVKGELQERYSQLKLKLANARATDKQNIHHLVSCCTKARKVLENLQEKGAAVEQLAVICRKYESDNQRYPLTARSEGATLPSVPVVTDFKMMTYKNFSKMDHFWEKYNRVRLDCACLMEEKSFLQSENNRLKIRMKRYLLDLTMMGNPTSSGSRTQQLGQRPKSMTIEKVECIELSRQPTSKPSKRIQSSTSYRPVTCIEGNLSVAIRSQRLLNRIPL